MDDIQKERPKTFLLLNENVFANDKWDVGRTDIVTHKIDTQHADPIRQKPIAVCTAIRINNTD